MEITLQTKLTLYPLNIQLDQKNYIVEDVASGEFYEMPQICIDAIQLMEKGLSLGEIEEKLKTTYQEEEVDILDFANQLIELDLVKEIDGEIIHKNRHIEKKERFLWISPKVGQFFFNRFMLNGYGVLLILNVFLFIFQPHLFPSYKDFFVFDVMNLNILVWLMITFCTVIIHEFGHVLAARAYDLPTKMGIGHRLFFVVFETDLSKAWSLRKNQRYVLYLAGMCFDQVILFCVLIAQLFFPNEKILAVIVLDIFIRTLFQFCFYMKTDLYYVVENWSGCYNLMENGKQWLSKWLPIMKQVEKTEIFKEEEKMVKLYALFYITGVTITCTLFIFYYIPQIIFTLKKTIPHLFLFNNSIYFWDALLIVMQLLIFISLLFYSLVKKRKEISQTNIVHEK